MFSFKYMLINMVVGFVATLVGESSELPAVAGGILVLAIVLTLANFGIGWAFVAILEMLAGMFIYNVTLGK